MNINMGEGSGHSYALFKDTIAAFLPKHSKPTLVLYGRYPDGNGDPVAMAIQVFVNDNLCIQWGGSPASGPGGIPATFNTDFPDAVLIGPLGSPLPTTAGTS